jgi:hypothetical protein
MLSTEILVMALAAVGALTIVLVARAGQSLRPGGKRFRTGCFRRLAGQSGETLGGLRSSRAACSLMRACETDLIPSQG